MYQHTQSSAVSLSLATYPSEDSFDPQAVSEVFSSFLPQVVFLHLFIGMNECGGVSPLTLFVRFMAERDSRHGGEECPAHAYWPLVA